LEINRGKKKHSKEEGDCGGKIRSFLPSMNIKRTMICWAEGKKEQGLGETCPGPFLRIRRFGFVIEKRRVIK